MSLDYGPWNPSTYNPPKKEPLLEKLEQIERYLKGVQYELNIIKLQIEEKYKKVTPDEHS